MKKYKEYDGFKFIRNYESGESFPSKCDFTHAAPNEKPFWVKPERVDQAWFGKNASCAVYMQI